MSDGYKTTHRPIRTQTVATASANANSAAIGAGVKKVRLYATKLCHIVIGDTAALAVATTSSMPLPADKPEYFDVPPGGFIGVIRNAEDGTLYITECG